MQGRKFMFRTRRLRVAGALLAVGGAAVVLAAAAGAGLIVKDSFHEENPFVALNFCGAGLTVDGLFVGDFRVHAVPKGPSGLAYFIENLRYTTVFTNRGNGKAVTEVGNVLTKDQKVTDNGNGTLTILVLATGNSVDYGPNGKAIARNPGQVRYEILIDDNGTPTDPDDDTFIADLGVVKGSTGRNDDFCGAVVPALS